MKKIRVLAALLFFLLPAVTGAQGVSLVERAAQDGISLYWDPLSETGMLEKNGHHISFRAGQDYVIQDYQSFLDEKAPWLKDGELLASSSFINTVDSFFNLNNTASNSVIGAILIDPGHGGKDPGAMAEYTIDGKKVTVREKDICLSIGLKLRDYLKKAYPDKKILMTRSTDVYLKLEERTDIANSVELKENEAILYISIHVNSSLDQSASGYEVWYLSPDYRRQVLDKQVSDDKNVQAILNDMLEEEYTTESILIAKLVLDGIGTQVGALSKSRGMKEEEWFVVRNSKMPSILVETGFLSNAEEAKLLMDDEYLKKLALGMYNGLQAFVTHFERSRGFTGVK
ncbi:MAG: N-acetylmuramoyl-L-alanine amidase [Treponema sp.]|nr:N-acetylmuramoyl-L-alanine amidase [Treponema sp.]